MDTVVLYDIAGRCPGLGALPGEGGNSVLFGELDSASAPCKGGKVPAPCEAVFMLLRDVKAGDLVELVFREKSYEYRVCAVCNVSITKFDTGAIFRGSGQETLTLFTHDHADFDFAKWKFTQYALVVAVRNPQQVVSCPPGTNPGLLPTPAPSPKPWLLRPSFGGNV